MIISKNIQSNFSILSALILTFFLLSSIGVDSQEKKEEKRTILELEKEKADNESGLNKSVKPIDPADTLKFSSRQDSNYTKALREHIPVLSRLEMDVKQFSVAWNLEQELKGVDPWEIARNNIKIPAKYLLPLGTEIVQREVMINNALYVPYMRSRNPYGLNVSIGDIASFLGLTEDLSPNITFKLDYTDEVEVKIYSVQASVVATLFSGVKQAGKHTLTWNLRDSKGRPMPPGDYIGEVRIGKTKYFRKRILIR
jgi:hypothetical protein